MTISTQHDVQGVNVQASDKSMQMNIVKSSDLVNSSTNDWCPGCGDNGVRTSITKLIIKLRNDPEYRKTIAHFNDNGVTTDLTVITEDEEEAEDIAFQTGIEKKETEAGLDSSSVMVVAGIGCSGKITNQLDKLYTFHSLHGRAISVAQGVKLANWDLEVIVTVGDGDGLGIGGNHFFHAGRKNLDMTIIVFDNQVYGLTKGQQSPTMLRDMQTKSMAAPAIKEGINPIAAAISGHYTFVAMSYSNQVKHLVETLNRGVKHKGTSFINVLQPCPTYNNIFTADFFKTRMKDLSDLAPDYDPVVRSHEERIEKNKKAYALGLEGYMSVNPEDGQRECYKGVYFEDPTIYPLELLWAEKIGPRALAKRDITNPNRKTTVQELMSSFQRI